MSRFRGKVVVIADDRVKTESIQTIAGSIKARRLFLWDCWMFGGS